MSPDADDMDAILNPGLARARDRERMRRDEALRAWGVIRRARASLPLDLAQPEPSWTRELADAIDGVLRAEWRDDQPSPDGVGGMSFSAADNGVEVDALLYLLPDGQRRLRVELLDDGGCVIRVAVPAESARSTDRLDPRRSMDWEFVVASPADAG